MSVCSGGLAESPASTPLSSIEVTYGSVVVSNRIRSPPGTNRQPDPGTIGGTGNIGGTLIQPLASGVMLNTPEAGLLTHTGMISMNGKTLIGRMNEPMLVAAIWPAVTACQLPRTVPSGLVSSVSKRYSISGAPSTSESP